jgi:hypothetical protein
MSDARLPTLKSRFRQGTREFRKGNYPEETVGVFSRLPEEMYFATIRKIR